MTHRFRLRDRLMATTGDATGPGPSAGRGEKKFLVRGAAWLHPQTALAAKAPELRTAYPPRQISSLYCDTHDYRSYAHSVGGISERTKLRIRWYGALKHATEPVLEFKEKRNHRGRKAHHPLAPIDFRSGTWREIQASIRAQLTEVGAGLRYLGHPVLINTYRRCYFATPDGQIRVTVDTGLRFYDQRMRSTPNFTFNACSFPGTILECKFTSDAERRAGELLRRLGARWTRLSKYCIGVEALSNRRALGFAEWSDIGS